MKLLKSVFTICLLLFTMTNACSQQDSPSAPAVYMASTPCSQGSRPLPRIPVDADCELIKWKLELYQDSVYKLHCVYGLPEQGTTGFAGGGKTIELEGKWTMVKGTASRPHAIIYRLHDDKTHQAISLLKLDSNLLHLLDSELRLMTGSAAWSYTFNRVKL